MGSLKVDSKLLGILRSENEIYQGTARDPGLPYHTQGAFLFVIIETVELYVSDLEEEGGDPNSHSDNSSI